LDAAMKPFAAHFEYFSVVSTTEETSARTYHDVDGVYCTATDLFEFTASWGFFVRYSHTAVSLRTYPTLERSSHGKMTAPAGFTFSCPS